MGLGILLQIPGFSASQPPARGSVLPCCLPQQRQSLLLQSLLLFRIEAHHRLDLARVERVLPQVAVPEQLALLWAEKKLPVTGLFNVRAALDGPCARWS